MDAVVQLDRHASTKRRSDAAGWCLSTGPHPQRRGARRTEAGQGHVPDVSHVEDLGTREEAPPRHLSTAVVGHKTLQRRWRLVVLLNRQDPAKPRFLVLGSTDPELHGRTRVALDAARFQSALLFRDRTQCTGLLDCQARAAALDFPCNAALATHNLVHAEDFCMPQSQEPRVFSMASWSKLEGIEASSHR